MNTTELILQQINYQEFYSKYVEELKKISPGQLQGHCPFHKDNKKSFSVEMSTGKYACHAGCGSGNVFTFLDQKLGIREKQSKVKFLANFLNISFEDSVKEEIKIVPESAYLKPHSVLIKNLEIQKELESRRGISLTTIIKYKLGFDRGRITIPIFDKDNKCVNIRKYAFKVATKTVEKMVSYKVGYGKVRLYPYENLEEKGFVFCEGETDCLLLNQYGIPAITVTGGAGSWKTEWNELIKDKMIYICMDIDQAGKRAAIKLAEVFHSHASLVKIIALPITTPLNGDITDFFITHSHTKDEFTNLLIDAEKFEPKEVGLPVDEKVFHEVNLDLASHADYYYKYIKTTTLVSGKDLTPFLVPHKIVLKCPQTWNEKQCPFCPASKDGGFLKMTFSLDSSQILEFIQIPKLSLDVKMRKLTGIPINCTDHEIEVVNALNVEQLRLIPDVDYSLDEQKYVVREAYYLGHGLEPNRVYEIKAMTLPDPKTQYSTHLIYEAKMAQDSIGAFSMMSKIQNALKIFQIK